MALPAVEQGECLGISFVAEQEECLEIPSMAGLEDYPGLVLSVADPVWDRDHHRLEQQVLSLELQNHQVVAVRVSDSPMVLL